MIVRRFFIVAALITAMLSVIYTNNAVAQDPFAGLDEDAIERISPFDPIETPAARSSVSRTGTRPSDVRSSQMSVSELRQARALYRSNQRIARIEYNLWMGHEPLRPKWNAVPMMSSRYGNRQVYVPIYIRAR